jgi:hypothetical protein
MRYLPRELERQVTAAANSFPTVVLTGPRRSGKTFLLRHLLPKASYHPADLPGAGRAQYQCSPRSGGVPAVSRTGR